MGLLGAAVAAADLVVVADFEEGGVEEATGEALVEVHLNSEEEQVEANSGHLDNMVLLGKGKKTIQRGKIDLGHLDIRVLLAIIAPRLLKNDESPRAFPITSK